MAERNNRHVGSPTPAPAILRARSVKHRPVLSRRTQSITTINYIKPGKFLPTENRTDPTHQPGINQAFIRVWCSMLFWVLVNYLHVVADQLHTVFARIQSAGQRLIVKPERNNRHVGCPTPAPAILLTGSFKKHRPYLSCMNQPKQPSIIQNLPIFCQPILLTSIEMFKNVSHRGTEAQRYSSRFSLLDRVIPFFMSPSTKIQTPQP